MFQKIISFTAFVLMLASIAFSGTPIIDLDATGLPLGTLNTWTNEGSLGGSFSATDYLGTNPPSVEDVSGRRAVRFYNTGAADPAADHMVSSFNAPASVTGTSDWSIATWVHNPVLSAYEYTVDWTDRGTSDATNQYIRVGYGSSTAGGAVDRYGTDLFFSVVPSAGVWHHIVYTFAGGTTGIRLKVYVDGLPDNSVDPGTFNVQPNQPFKIGGAYWTGNYNPEHLHNPFSGSLARVQVYDYELSPAEIAILAAGGSPKAYNPDPVNAETGVDINGNLTWSPGMYAVSHDVYLGLSFDAVNNATTASPEFKGNQEPNVYDPPTLNVDTTYYWRIDEVNTSHPESPWKGSVWSFTTGNPMRATNPSPEDTAAGVDPNADISWTAGYLAVSHDVYFGTDSSAVTNATHASPEFKGNQAQTSYDPGPMSLGLTYYWRIDEVNSTYPNSPCKGFTWSFSVASTFGYGDNVDVTFFVTTDLHYGVGTDEAIPANQTTINLMNTLPGTGYPASIGGTVDTPRAVISTGDITEAALAEEWNWLIADYGVNGEGLLNYPSYEGWGNHDDSTVVRNGVYARNLVRPGLTSVSTNGYHYSWDWDGVHFVHLNIYPGTGEGDPASWGNPKDSLPFLQQDLAASIGTSGRPIVIFMHFAFDGWGLANWQLWEQDAFYDAIVGYNVIALIGGHGHAALSGVWRGFDYYEIQASQPVQDGKGFGVIKLTNNKLAIAMRNNTGSWGSVFEKPLGLPTPDPLADVIKGPYLIYPGNNTQMTVLWQVDETITCKLEWGRTMLYSDGSTLTTEFGSDHQHKYNITGLVPGEKYFYRVTEIGRGGFETGTFYAAPASSATSVKFIAYGDTRSQPAVHNTVNAAMVDLYESDPTYQTIALFSGDWASADTETAWATEFFPAAQTGCVEFRKNVPMQGCWGNHEGGGICFEKYYPYPYVAPEYWSFDYGPVHVAVIDQSISYATGSAQHNWLINDLSTSSKTWKFIVLHQPGYTAAGGHDDDTNVQNYIQPLCVQYGVQIVFGGHNHYYARETVNTIKHITTGGGGAPLYTPNPSLTEVCSSSYHFCKVAINGTDLEFTAIKPDGTVIDSFTLSESADTNPPTPNPATFATAPTAQSQTAITMTATTGSDASPPVQYYFDETSGNPGGTDSGWQTSTTYVDSGLNPNTQYTYTVQMRDALLNTGTASAPASATTLADTNPPTPNPATWATVPYAVSSSEISMTATTGTDDFSPPVQYYFDETTGNPGGTDSGWISSPTYNDTGLNPNTQYTYRVQMRDALLNTGSWSTSQSATTLAAMPTFVTAGAVASGTKTITPALPSGIASGDILLLFIETANQAISITNQNGGTWTEVTGSPQGTGTAAGASATRLTVFWSRYNGTQGAPTVSDSGDHQIGRIVAIRGAVATGNPWDVTAGGVEATADTSGSIPGATTTVNNTLVVAAISTSLPDATGTANFSSWANADLTSVTERTDNTSSAGNGGGIGVVTGIKATAGAYGNTTVTCGASAVKGMISIAIKP